MPEEKKILGVERVEEIVSHGGIFIWDTSSLCADGFKKCVQTIFSVIQNYSNRFVVPSFVVEGLKGDLGAPAMMVIDRNLFAVLPNVNDYGELFESLKERNITKVNFLINNPKIKGSLIAEGKEKGIFVYFYTLNENGEIENFRFSPKPEKGPEQRKSEPRQTGFRIKNRPEKIAFAPISVTANLGIGDIVYDSAGDRVEILEQQVVNNGAVTYAVDRLHTWVKIFDKSSLNTYLEAKIQRMLTQKLECDGLCWPIDLVRDSEGNFRGYLFTEYKGVPLHLCVFKRAGIDTYFPDWNKLDLCELTQTILKKIEFLHQRNVLFGCINPAAIRVVSKDEVYFTDVDNYQVDGFPSLVHNISFTAPELLDKKVYLATKANENFAIAELVFMLMMPGKTPYAVGGDEAPEELIKSMKFPYSNGKVHGDRALPGMWRFMWSHLSGMKGAFFNVFQNGAKYSKPEDRRDVIYWESALSHYMDDLRETQDQESLMIYPKTFKRGGGEEFFRCNYCGVEHPRFYFYDKYFDDFRICNGCVDKRSDVSFTCKTCGKTYYYTNRTALFHRMKKMTDSDWKDQTHCRDCKRKTIPCKVCGKQTPFYYGGRCVDCLNAAKNEVYRTIRCADCGCSFDITVMEHENLQKKGWEDPIRCKSCRDRRRNGGGGYGGGSRQRGGIFGWLFD